MSLRPLAIVLALALTQTASPAVAQVRLVPKFTEGATVKIRNSQKLKLSMEDASGNKTVTKADVTITSRMVFGQRDSEKKLTYKTKVDSIVADMVGPGGKITFDSAHPDDNSNPNAEMALDGFRTLLDMTLTSTLDKDNQLISVEGIEEGPGLTFENLKAAYTQTIDRLPKEPVKKGDTWERTEQMEMDLPGAMWLVVVKRKFEYAGTTAKSPTVKDGPKLDKITVTELAVEFKDKGNDNPAKIKASDVKVVSSKHALLFDRELGRTVDDQDALQVKGKLKVSFMGTDLEGALDMTIETRIQEIK